MAGRPVKRMIKKITVAILLVFMLLLLCGCDSLTDNSLATKATNTKAYIKINEKTIAVDVKEYLYGSNGVVIIYETDGKAYKTHSANVVLVKDAEDR